ncbi:hypothetical protein HYH03_003003 [Edaphochlamys debaryana]|uniref:DAGKc domain-containing protein n=1 Tax=Edaphochlamys debaryana TaxID=47281 RepID=A0A835YBS2_9CHLO|nr:hypothetical protein HYH03_003003 [Edaphochlamys debaryana]|eukprot:KAG2498809.1 hypothetical protein HYH03_003003 [Edaphochlamys debaryana]
MAVIGDGINLDVEQARPCLRVRTPAGPGVLVLEERRLTFTPDLTWSPFRHGPGFLRWLTSLFRRNKAQSIPVEQLLGARLENPAGTAFTVWYAVERVAKAGCVERRSFKLLHTPRFEVANTPGDVEAVAELVTHIRRTSSWWGRATPPHLAAIVNPVSGRGGAARVVDSHLLPLLRDVAGLRVTVMKTRAPMHAAELVRDLTLNVPPAEAAAAGAAAAGGQGAEGAEGVDAIVFVGGDGTLYEGLQGLFQRPDWASAVRVPLAAVPCGSGNGVAASAGMWDADTAVVALCRGRAEPVDVASVLQPPGSRFYCVLSVVYGAMANLDIGTQHLRWMGELRFHLGGVWEIIRGRCYSARVFFLPPEAEAASASASASALAADGASAGPRSGAAGGVAGAQAVPVGAAARGAVGAAAGTAEAGAGGMEERLLPSDERSRSGDMAAGAGAGLAVSDYPAGPPLPILSGLRSLPSPLPDTTDTLPAGWRKLPDSFAVFGAYNTQYLALGARMNPGGRMGDGAWDVWHMEGPPGVGRNASSRPAPRGMRMRSLRMLLGTEDGSFANTPGVLDVVKARALLFEQRDVATYTVLDGEQVPDRPLYLECHPGLCRLMVSPSFQEPR